MAYLAQDLVTTCNQKYQVSSTSKPQSTINNLQHSGLARPDELEVQVTMGWESGNKLSQQGRAALLYVLLRQQVYRHLRSDSDGAEGLEESNHKNLQTSIYLARLNFEQCINLQPSARAELKQS